MFLRCFGCFPVILGFSVQYTSASGFTPVSELFFSVLVSGLPTVKTGPPSAKFSPLAQTSVTLPTTAVKISHTRAKHSSKTHPNGCKCWVHDWRCLLLLFQSANESKATKPSRERMWGLNQNRHQKVFNRGLCICAGCWHSENLTKSPLIYSVSYFSL